MIVDRIAEYMETQGREIPPEVMAIAMKRLQWTIKRNLGEQEERSRARNISGSLAWFCPRRAYYQLTGAEQEKLTGRARMTFMMGDVLQATVDVLATLAGVEFAYPDAEGEELELRQDIGGVEVVGHVDHALRIEGEGLVVLDSKSMADYGFGEFEKAARDPEADWWRKEKLGYIAQIRFYMMLVRMAGLGTGERAAFIGINKNNGKMAELWVKRDEAMEQMFLRAIPVLAEARQRYFSARDLVVGQVLEQGGSLAEADAAGSAVTRDEAHGLLPRAKWAKTVEVSNVKLPDGSRGRGLEVCTDKELTDGNGWRCNYCPFTAQCWPGFELVPMSSGPVWRKANNSAGGPA